MLFAVASAQEPTAEQIQQQIEQQIRYLQSPRQQIHWEADQLAATRSPWNGQGTWMPLRFVMRSGSEAELELTEEQKQRLSFLYLDNELAGPLMERMRNNPTPEFIQKVEHAQAIRQAALLPDDPFFERATDEQKDAFREATILSMRIMFIDLMQTEIEETLTPEQMLQVRKLEMQLMPAIGIPFPSMFDPLDLTDEQKAEMNEIADEMKAEFERLTMEEAALKAERLVATFGLLQGKSFASREEFQKAQQEIHSQFVPSEAMRKKALDLQERGTKFVSLLQNRLMDVLTDEQLGRMQEILDATPEFAKQMIAQFKASREAAKQSPSYVPGPDSWQPGDPIPESYRQEKEPKGNFPRPAD
jgi:Ni/Co efflux regulator RcnB